MAEAKSDPKKRKAMTGKAKEAFLEGKSKSF